ncbi:MAG: DNA adenine methylase [Termitinemataceae bacterium]|nr:MAG: DNA adenine methylase [Termitinemataceae bacterium]
MFGVVSPLRYPGGKSRAIKTILPLIPFNAKHFCEPFVGGGSVFLATKQNCACSAEFTINDLNYDLYCFWKYIKENNQQLYQSVLDIKNSETDGRKLFEHYTKEADAWNEFERAVRFFVLNRITFSGTVDSGGYSQKAFTGRFTYSSIERIKPLENVMSNVTIKNKDYEEIIGDCKEGTFIFLDPPYYRQSKSRLYGKNGDLHTSFDHERFAEVMKNCRCQWLITLDNTDKIKELFDFAYIQEWELQYGMNNYKQGKADKGQELFISNYEINPPEYFERRSLIKNKKKNIQGCLFQEYA